MLDMGSGTQEGAELLAEAERRMGRRLPAAVRDWFSSAGDRRLAELSDNQIADPASFTGDFLKAGLLLLETDSQYCCQMVAPLDDGDNPPVYVVDPDDFGGTTRSRYAENFTTYTEAVVWDAILRGVDDAVWSFDHEVPPDAVKDLAALLSQGPTTYGWAHNQGCDAVYRFDGEARVSLALADGTAVWTVTSAPDPELRTVIADTLCIPASDR
jgi:hypothetical protein